MGGQAKATDSSAMQRVKLYRLNDDGKWDDQGTGHVSLDYVEGSKDVALTVVDEKDSTGLLTHNISSDDIYRRQDETIISWKDPELRVELALSFQEAAGCLYIWETICSIQRNLQFSNLGEEPFRSLNSDLRELPTVELSTLPLLLKTVLDCSITDQMHVSELILQDQEFFPKLFDLFRVCDNLDNLEDLHMIYRLVLGIILMNSPSILERMLADEFILDVIGALEYDPDVPNIQHHRAFLKEHVVFKEAIPIKNSSVLSKIHLSYRIGYLKDVILPRTLDDGTAASLNTMIHANNAAVISLLKDDACFIQEFFARLKSPNVSIESKRDLVLFLHEFCSLSKSLQLVQQLRLFRDFANEGVFDIIVDVLQCQDRKLISAGTDILILFLNQDPILLRSYIIQQEGNTLLRLLVKGMITDAGEDMHCQFLEIIRILVDSYTMSGSQREQIIEIFYERHLDQLVDVIASSCPPVGGVAKAEAQLTTRPEILSNICELLCFCVMHHPYRTSSACNLLISKAIEKILSLTRRKEKYLVVAAVRFLRTVISRSDEHTLRHIVKHDLLRPVVGVFVENGNRYNMLQSGVLELFEVIKREEQKLLVANLVGSFWDQLVKFDHLRSVQALRTKYEQYLEKREIKDSHVVLETCKVQERGLEKEEEDYFNEDSDEEDSARPSAHAQSRDSRAIRPNGTKVDYTPMRAKSGGLVDYDDDDDNDEGYNPPPRKRESSAEDDEPLNMLVNKRKPPNADNNGHKDCESKKKQKHDAHIGPAKVSIASSVRKQCDMQKRLPSSSATRLTGQANGEAAQEVPVPLNHASLAEECSTAAATGSSSPDRVVKTAQSTDSEPYPVR